MVLLVAPHAGAWIETVGVAMTCRVLVSRPMRARGLKLFEHKDSRQELWSRPMRARGLKLHFYSIGLCVGVAPHAGAWIETAYAHVITFTGKSRPMRARGLKHQYDPSSSGA